MSERFPDKPKDMHWQTYERLRRAQLARGKAEGVLS